MRKTILLFTGIIGLALSTTAQTASNWTLTAHSQSTGQTYTLFDILNSGKSVVLDFFQPECGPCMSWHMHHTMEDFYQLHGPNGDNTAMCFMINTFANTGWTEITGANSMSFDWSDGVTYPIVTIPTALQNQILNAYSAWGTPTVWRICPNKSMDNVFELEVLSGGNWVPGPLVSTAGLETWHTTGCVDNVGLEEQIQTEVNLYPNPATDYFEVQTESDEPVFVEVFNMLGESVLVANSKEGEIDISNLINGIYSVRLTQNQLTATQRLIINK